MQFRQHIILGMAIFMALAVGQTALAAQETTVTVSFQRSQFFFDQVRGFDRVRLVGGQDESVQAAGDGPPREAGPNDDSRLDFDIPQS